MLSQEFIDTCKNALIDEMTSIESDLATLGNKDASGDWSTEAPAIDESEFDYTVNADRVEEFENNINVAANLEMRLKDIKDALSKIESGVYGICETSGEDIEMERLEANKAARTCVKHMNSHTSENQMNIEDLIA